LNTDERKRYRELLENLFGIATFAQLEDNNYKKFIQEVENEIIEFWQKEDERKIKGVKN